MRKRIIPAVCIVAAFSVEARADGVAPAAAGAPAFNWTGYYFGAHLGAGVGRSQFSDPYGPSIYGDTVRAPEAMIGLQGGYNWQAPGSRWVLGAEADISGLAGDGSNTCFAFSGEYVSANCRASADIAGSLAGRLGYAAGAAGQTLLYLKGGAAVVHSDITATTNRSFAGAPQDQTGAGGTSWGWLLGGGVEQAVSPAWSVKFEYDYIGLDDRNIATPPSILMSPFFDLTEVPSRTASIDQHQQMVKVGLNYRLGTDPHATGFAGGLPGHANAYDVPPGWALQTAGRYWYSVGRFQKTISSNLGLSTSTNLVSRLTYDDMGANAGEIYARLDSPWKVFFKGYLGAGTITNGHLTDEDWGLDPEIAMPVAYSNTYSGLNDNGMRYGTIDAGYDLLRGKDYRAGLFAGYANVHEKYSDRGCAQLASPSPDSSCFVPDVGGVGISEIDTWNGVRLGFATDVWLTPSLQLTADAAYLPRVWFKGRDNHWNRDLVFDENGAAQGGQFELLLSYYLMKDLSVGVGARYWALWTTSGGDFTNGNDSERPDTYDYERYGVFVQGAYTFDFCCATNAALK